MAAAKGKGATFVDPAGSGRVPFNSLYSEYPLTSSIEQQKEVESDVRKLHECAGQNKTLLRPQHEMFAVGGLGALSGGLSSLDASRTWLVYWSLNALDLLGKRDRSGVPQRADMVKFLRSCFTVCRDEKGEYGGFGGGPTQQPHLAPTYSATMALVVIGTDEALEVLKERKALLEAFFQRLKLPTGAVVMHEGGEVDIRASYCMTVVATLTGLGGAVLKGLPEFIVRCQTHEGGLACQPYEEAHGGYTFCGTAALALMRRLEDIDMRRLRSWLVRRQAAVEGGFNGRTNKLTDACYSAWIGGTFAVLEGVEADMRATANGGLCVSLTDLASADAIAYRDADESLAKMATLSSSPASAPTKSDDWETVHESGLTQEQEWVMGFEQQGLQDYIMHACQEPRGGLKDKPGLRPDFYHTNYSLLGLAMAQQLGVEHLRNRYGVSTLFSGESDMQGVDEAPDKLRTPPVLSLLRGAESTGILQHSTALLRHICPLFLIRRDRAARAFTFFHGRPVLPPRVL